MHFVWQKSTKIYAIFAYLKNGTNIIIYLNSTRYFVHKYRKGVLYDEFKIQNPIYVNTIGFDDFCINVADGNVKCFGSRGDIN